MLPSSLYRLNLHCVAEVAAVVHRDGGSAQHVACVPEMGNAGAAPEGERLRCFPRTDFAKSEEQLCPKPPQCFSPSAKNSSPEASTASSPSRGHHVSVPGVPAPLPSSLDLPHFWQTEGIRDSLGKGCEPSGTAASHAAGHPVVGLAPGREGTAAGGQGQLGSRASRRRAVVLAPALLWDVMVRGGRGGKAPAVKCLTAHLAVRLESPPRLGEQLRPLLRMTTLLQPEASHFCLNLLYCLGSQKTRWWQGINCFSFLTDLFKLFYRKVRLNNLSRNALIRSVNRRVQTVKETLLKKNLYQLLPT